MKPRLIKGNSKNVIAMNLLKEVTKEVESKGGPAVPKAWNIADLSHHGVILSCDGFQLKLDIEELNKFFDIAESGEPGEIKDENGKIVLVEPTDDSIVLTRANDPVYPSGVTLDLKTLKLLGIEADKQNDEDKIDEAVKAAFRRSGGKIKRGFRVTSGHRKGRVVANVRNAFKPRAKASTRMKLRISRRKKKLIRVLKSKRTRRKSLSKRLARMNAAKK